MKMKRLFLVLALLAGVGGVAHAQLLKKLEEKAQKAQQKISNTLEKVNEKLETVNQTLDSVLEGNLPTGTASYEQPHITKYTVRIPVPDDTEIECISEGIVTLSLHGKLAFYSLRERKMLTEFEWQGTGRYGEATAFSGGACAVKKDGSYYILYPDGTCKDLSGTDVREIGNFHGGIAPGKKKKGDWGSEAAFFDRDGQPVLEDLVQGLGAYAELAVRNSHNGLRAVQAGKWGFVDPAGRVVVKPQYARVSDFSEGYALVSSGQNKFGVIDKTGAVVLAESIPGGYQDPRAFHDGWAYLPGVSSFVNLQGVVREDFSQATDFSEGRMIANVDYSNVGLFDKEFKTQKVLKGHDGSSLHIGRGAPDHLVSGHYLLEDYSDTYLFNKEGELVLATNSSKCKMTALHDGGYLSLVMDKSGDDPYSMAAVAVCAFSGKIIVIFDRKSSYTEIGGPGEVEEDPEETIEPEPEPEPYLVVSPGSYLFKAEGGVSPFFVSGNVDWTLSTSASWLSVSTGRGSGLNTCVQLNVAENTQTAKRTATVTAVGGGLKAVLLVTQLPKEEEEEEEDGPWVGGRRRWGYPPRDKDGNLITVFDTEYIWNPREDGPNIEKIRIFTNLEKDGKDNIGRDTLIIAVDPPDSTIVLPPRIDDEPLDKIGTNVFRGKLPGGYVKLEVPVIWEDDPKVKQKWALGGHRDFGRIEGSEVSNLEADVQLVADPAGIPGTPFGEDTKGLLIVDFKQDRKFTAYWNDDRNQPIKDFGTYYWSPFRITGWTKEYDGKKYIHLIGGITAIGNWMDRPDDQLGGLLITLIMSLSDFNDDNTGGDPTYAMMTRAHRYRLSYTDLPDGGMKLGVLERYSNVYGWVPSNDARLIEKKTKDMGLLSMSEQSEIPMEPEILQGTELHWIQRPANLPNFYPGRNWFLDEEQYRHTVEVFNRMYRSQNEKEFGERWYTREECQQFIKDFIVRWGLTLMEK